MGMRKSHQIILFSRNFLSPCMKESDNMENLKWYVLNYDFNAKKIENFNIFRSVRFTEGVQELLEHYITFEDFVEKLESELRYSFWSKREYEIFVGDAFETNIENFEKIDIYSQVKPNVKILAKYIIDNYNSGLSC